MHKCASERYIVDDNRAAHLNTYTMLYIFGDEKKRYRNLNGLSVFCMSVIIRKNRSSSGPCGEMQFKHGLTSWYSSISLSWKFPG